MLEQLQAIWAGYLQFGFSDTTKLMLMLVDIVLLAITFYFFLQKFNTRRGLSYFLALVVSLLLLILTAYLALPGIHFLAQVLLVILIIGLPLFFHETWVSLFTTRAVTNQNLPPRERFLGNFSLIFFGIIIALVIVLFSHGVSAKTGELPQKVTISAVNLPTGTSANLGEQNSVQLLVTAPRDQWDNLKADTFSATVDIANQKEGTYDLPVNVTAKISDIKIIRIRPSRVTVTIEPIIVKTVPVVARITGQAGDELVPDEPQFNPDKVEVSGPKSVVTDLTQAIVQVKLNGETKPLDQKYPVVGLTPSGEIIANLTFNPTEVQAKVALVKAGKLKTVGVRPVISGQPAAGFWVKHVTSTPSTVVLTGTVEALDKIADLPTESVSVAGLNSPTTLSANLVLPSGVSLAEKVEKVSLKIEVAETTTTKTITPEIIYEGLSSGLKVTVINPTSVATVVSGASAMLNSLANGEVKLKIDLSAYKSAGQYSVTIKNDQFTLPNGLSLTSFLPSAVDITLENK